MDKSQWSLLIHLYSPQKWPTTWKLKTRNFKRDHHKTHAEPNNRKYSRCSFTTALIWLDWSLKKSPLNNIDQKQRALTCSKPRMHRSADSNKTQQKSHVVLRPDGKFYVAGSIFDSPTHWPNKFHVDSPISPLEPRSHGQRHRRASIQAEMRCSGRGSRTQSCIHVM